MTASLQVLDGGPLTTVQDAGRPGYADQGVPPSGAADRRSFQLANRLVGNEPDQAALEATFRGPRLRLVGAGAPRTMAMTGARAPVTLDGTPVGPDSPFAVRPGQTVEIGTATAGARMYLAVSGGIAVAAVLGSRSADLLSGLGPLPILAGGQLPLGADLGRRGPLDVAPVAPIDRAPTLRVWAGPRADWFVPEVLDELGGSAWTVGAESNRVGLRLSGPVLARAVAAELPPEGIVTGALQVPASGQPVLFLHDHPVTGGYPVVGVVVDEDLPTAAQAAPGTQIWFRIIG